jgi:hypothetical protein
LAQGHFHVDVGGFLRAEFKEIFGISDPVTFGFKFSFFFYCPYRCSLFDILLVSLEPAFAGINYHYGGSGCFFLKDLQNQYGVRIDAKNDAPSYIFIDNSQFVAIDPYRRHRSGVRHTQVQSSLKLSQKIPCFNAGTLGKRGCRYLAMKPN